MLNVDVTEAVSALALEQEKQFVVELEAAPVDELISERAAAVEKLQRYNYFSEAVDAANQRLEAARAELRSYELAERRKLIQWGKSSIRQDPPTRDVEAFAALVAMLEDAERHHSAAVAVRDSVAVQCERARQDVLAVQLKFDQRIANEISTDVITECKELRAIIDDCFVRHARILAAKQILFIKAQAFLDAQNFDRAGAFGGAASRLADIEAKVVIEPSQQTIQGHFAHWTGRISS